MSTSLFIDNINRTIVNKHIETIMNLIREKNLYIPIYIYIYIYIYIRMEKTILLKYRSENNFV